MQWVSKNFTWTDWSSNAVLSGDPDPLLMSSVLNQILRIYLIWIKNNKNIRMFDVVNTAVVRVFRTFMIRFLEIWFSNNWFSNYHPCQKYHLPQTVHFVCPRCTEAMYSCCCSCICLQLLHVLQNILLNNNKESHISRGDSSDTTTMIICIVYTNSFYWCTYRYYWIILPTFA